MVRWDSVKLWRVLSAAVLLWLAALAFFLALAPERLITALLADIGALSEYIGRTLLFCLGLLLLGAVFARGIVRQLRRRFAFFARQRAIFFAVIGLLIVWLLVYLIPEMWIFVKPGQAGVLWRRFGGGTVMDHTYGEGTHIILPWDKMYIYDVRLQHRDKVFEVLSKDGLQYNIAVTVRFRLLKEDLPDLHRHVGPNYVETLIFPEIGSQARALVSQYRTDEVYTEARLQIEGEVLQRVKSQLMISYLPNVPRESYLHVEDVLFREIILPQKVKNAIEDKLAQEQQMLEYDFRLTKESKEAERKRIEAEGIRDFQETVQRGITDSYLKWKGIEATLELAKSPNSKVVVIGAGDDGLPLILGGFDTPVAPPPATAGAKQVAPGAGLPSAPQRLLPDASLKLPPRDSANRPTLPDAPAAGAGRHLTGKEGLAADERPSLIPLDDSGGYDGDEYQGRASEPPRPRAGD